MLNYYAADVCLQGKRDTIQRKPVRIVPGGARARVYDVYSSSHQDDFPPSIATLNIKHEA